MRQIYVIPDRTRLEESIALRREYQLKWEFNDFFMPDILDDEQKQKEIIETYMKTGIDFSGDTMHGAFLDVTLHSQDRFIKEISEKRVYQSMEIACKLGVKGVVFHTNRLQNFRDENYLKNWHAASKAFYETLCEKYPGVEVYLENMFDEAPDVMQELAEDMKGTKNFGICFDYAHASLYGKDRKEWFRLLAPYIRHMHINDNDGLDDLHMAIGDGVMDYGIYNEMLTELSLEPSILIEVKGLEKQRRSLEYMQAHSILPY